MEFGDQWFIPESAAAGLHEISDLQQRFDAVHWTGPGEREDQRRHIGFHLTIAAAKLARIEERSDHGLDDDGLVREVAADLLVYAVQLSRYCKEDLGELYANRLRGIQARHVQQSLTAQK